MKELVSAPTLAARAREIVDQKRVPQATYRLQLHRDFRFCDVKALVPYFHSLGITDLYLSPILKARPGSTHGYDICDHTKINSELGNDDDFAALCAEISQYGLGIILDTVPNHMGIDSCNPWWMDVLENGPSSIYARFFDIDWDPAKAELKDKILLPILEGQYGKALESGQLKLVYDSGAFFICYLQTRLPLAPVTYSNILNLALQFVTAKLPPDDPHVQELKSIVTAVSYLPARTERDLKRVEERNREKEIIKRRLAALYESSSEFSAALDEAVQQFNGIVGDPHSFDDLDALLNEQAYRPAFWRVAGEEINYRRFFDINDLAAIRMEEAEVFRATHELTFLWLTKRLIAGLRIDHADGLWDPAEYLRQLQYTYLLRAVEAGLGTDAISKQPIEEAVREWFTNQFDAKKRLPLNWPLYVVVEKVLSAGESLPQDWAVDGTTGYEFLSAVNSLFVDAGQKEALTQSYSDFIGRKIDFGDLVNSTKKMIMLVALGSEIYALSHELARIATRNRRYRDFTLNSLTFAIREIVAALKVYRTYISGPGSVPPWDRAYIDAAVTEAKKRNPRTAEALFDFVRDTLLLQNLSDFAQSDRGYLINWVMKIQQVTGPVMAKGVEDTGFYVFNRLISLNEVGGNPEEFGISLEAFHQQNLERARRWPHSMLASTTHDTKRSEDARARINVLSELPHEWARALARWSAMNALQKTIVDGSPVPDANEEYLFYQTLIGSWPVDRSGDTALSGEEQAHFSRRIAEYMHKAIKEAKVHTSWINPNLNHEDAVRDFVVKTLGVGESNPFPGDFRSFLRPLVYWGALNSLSQLLLKLTSPGVPDVYQGSELWDLRLVDPDNRTPVDYQIRVRLLTELKTRLAQIEQSRTKGVELLGLARELLSSWADGRIKLYVMERALKLRQTYPQLFSLGSYEPMQVRGDKTEHVCAYSRIYENGEIMVAVPRFVARLTSKAAEPALGTGIWQHTGLDFPEPQLTRVYRNVFTGEALSTGRRGYLPLAEIFAHFPVALLERVRDA